ncbi:MULTISPECIES: cation diffusion facilitator family transporter [Streptococcus]|uniref:Cobalt-zinc-cadmium efflux system protein n=1 Tax=Streptococcus porcorum TaxID=701526 RepID=A0ABV2JCP8_9STRE|nr:cation diffusion facilitator family transporter [Streptococcus sp.]MDY3824794.1 cation diffusion facilitator family transporter [Streptococcus sp.]
MARRNVFIAFLLNLVFSIIELIFGLLFKSSAILADAVHDFGDALAIGLSFVTERMSDKRADQNFSLGYKRFSLLGAMITSSILILGSVFLIVENFPKLFHPEVVNKEGMLILGVIAIIINVLASLVVHKGKTVNEAILSLHFLEDILGWLAVILVSIVLRFTDWYFLDPLLSLVISAFILSKAVPKFWDNGKLFLNATPKELDFVSLEAELLDLEGVENLNQLNVWTSDGLNHQAVVHICKTSHLTDQAVKEQIYTCLSSHHIQLLALEIDQDQTEHEKHGLHL